MQENTGMYATPRFARRLNPFYKSLPRRGPTKEYAKTPPWRKQRSLKTTTL